MGRDKPARVEGTPRGLGLYRRQGREGFFFIKNWSPLAKRHPGAFERGGQYDEWIKRVDGTLVTSVNEAKAYCYKRNSELESRKLAVQGAHESYSGEDLEAIAQQLADQWITAKRRGVNLQGLDLGLWRAMEAYKDKIEEVEQLGMGGALVIPPMPMAEEDDLPDKPYIQMSAEEKAALAERLRTQPFRVPEHCGPTYWLPLPALKEESQKLERLCWDQGFRPCQDDLAAIRGRFTALIQDYIDQAQTSQALGELRAPTPALPIKGLTWQRLISAKETEGIAAGTTRGMSKAIDRLTKWLDSTYSVKLPTSINGELAMEYRDYLTTRSGLKRTTAAKELRYIKSIFQAARAQDLIASNPFSHLPKDRRSKIKTAIDARKTVDRNKIIGRERFQQIFAKMIRNKDGKTDPSIDVFLIQCATGARIQEVAGLRRCDFTLRQTGKTFYYCVEVKHWEGRGLGAIEGRGGLKTMQSERIIPLPSFMEDIWKKYSSLDSKEPAFPQEAPRSNSQNWGDRLSRRMREKCEGFPGTHAWRETLINNARNSGYSSRIIEMLTGKSSVSTLSDYTSDNLQSMQEAIEVHCQHLGLVESLAVKLELL